MAIPITSIPSTTETAKETAARLEAARLRHADAIISAYQLIQQLEDAKVFDLLRGALGAGDVLTTKLATAANSADAIHAVRNLVSLSRILGGVDPGLLHRLADELPAPPASKALISPPSFWTTIRTLAGPDSRRALAGAAAFLQAFGRALQDNKLKPE